jgi:hypothetical protein
MSRQYGRRSDSQPSEVWDERWVVLQATINALKDRTAGTDDPTVIFIRSALNSLESFAEQLINYFRADRPRPPQLTRDYALRVILNQVGHDVSLYSQAFFQRTGVGERMQQALKVADAVADAMLKPARDQHMFVTPVWQDPDFNKPVVVTYAQKSPSIRVIPYAPIALIAFPYSCVKYVRGGEDKSVMRDFLAVAHEVGHYVYRHGRLPETNKSAWLHIYRALPRMMHELTPTISRDDAEWAKRWVEESFADVYGCRVAGPIMALNFQDFLLENNDDLAFITDDDKHPSPNVRGEIFTQTLERMNVEETWPARMRDRWLAKRATIPDAASIFIQDNQKRPIADAQRLLVAMIAKLNDLLGEIEFDQDLLFGFRNPSSWVDHKEVNDLSRIAEDGNSAFDQGLYAKWETEGVNLLNQRPRVLQASPPIVNWGIKTGGDDKTLFEVWQSELVSDYLNSLPPLSTQVKGYQTIDGIPISLDEANRRQLEWLITLNAASWTTEGPDGDPPKTI